jgi:hypothetical protein
VVRVWERWPDDHPGARRLPVVSALVLHHGPRRWAAPRALSDLYDLPRGVLATTQANLPELRFALDGLAAVDEQALLARPAPPFAAAALGLLQAAPRGQPLESVFGVVLRLLTRRFGALAPERAARIRAAGEADLDAIADRLLPAATLAEALGDLAKE